MKLTLTNEQWQKILPVLQSCGGIYIGSHFHCRKFLSAVLWMLRSGAQWRLLPAEYGDWNTVYKRFNRWSRAGVFEKLFEFFAQDADFKNIMIDSTVVRAHACAAGAQKKLASKPWGAVAADIRQKIHLTCDALGRAVRVILTAGQRDDSTQAQALIKGLVAKAVLGDKAFDIDALLRLIAETGATAVIPPRRNRREQREIDWHLYRERHLIECFIGKLKHYRRVFSRFDKLAKNYLSFVYFASTLIWLR